MEPSTPSTTTPVRPAFRLSKPLQFWVYLTYGVLFLSGLAWFIGSRKDDSAVSSSNDWQPFWLKIHGASAMLALIILGILIPIHIQRAWKAGKNLLTGSFMISLNAILIVTAYGLYYCGDETWRHWMSQTHIILGLLFPLALTFHIWIGRRR